jgi:hypothetical protein
VEDSHRNSNVIPNLNATFLALIPMEDKVEDPIKFHVTSLCIVVYKIITKFIANCLKYLLFYIFYQEQTSYVERWKILDGIILTHEFIHSLKTKTNTWDSLKK